MNNGCNIKTSQEALNHGLESFEMSFKYTQGDMDESIKFAMNEIQNKYPDLNFEPSSFSDYVTEIMKESGLIPKNYKFGKKKTEQKIKEKEKTSEINRIKKEEKDSIKLWNEFEKEVGSRKKEEQKNKDFEKKWLETEQKIKEKALKKVTDILDKFKGLSKEQKPTVARNLIIKLMDNGMIKDTDVLNEIAKATGKPEMNEKVLDQSDKVSEANKNLDEVNNQISEKIAELNRLKQKEEGLSEEDNKRIDKELKDLKRKRLDARNEAIKQAQELSLLMEPYHFFWWDMMSAARLNLMGMKSLLKNFTGGVADAVIRNMGDAVASTGASIVFPIMKKTNPLPFGKKAIGGIRAIKEGNVKKNLEATFKYGKTEFSSELPAFNYMNSVNKWRNFLDSQGKEKAKNLAGFLLRVSPDAVQRILSATDTAPYTLVYEGELESIADSKGLKGAEKTAFLMNPDEKSVERAQKKADQATFREDNWVTEHMKWASYNPYTHYQELIKKGTPPWLAKLRTSFLQTMSIVAVPFVKTPINIILQAQRYLLPEVELARGIMESYREKDANTRNKILAESTGRAIAGIYLRNIALNMVAQGLITAGYSDEDRRAMDTQELAKGGPSRINLSALARGMAFRGYKAKKGDMWVDLSSIGFTGILLGTYAHAYSRMSKEEKEQSMKPSITNEAMLALSEAQSSLDNTFLSGLNQLYQAFADPEGKKFQKFGINTANVILTGTFPSTYQKLSTQWDPNVKKQYDNDLTFSENLLNSFGYRYAFMSDGMKNKYFNLSPEGKEGPKQKKNILFNNYTGRLLEQNFDVFGIDFAEPNSTAYKLNQASGKANIKDRHLYYPSGIDQQQTIGRERIKLTDSQYEFLLQSASKWQMFFSAPVINSQEFEKSSPESQQKSLQTAYKEGLKQAKLDLENKYGIKNIKSQSINKEKDVKVEDEINKLEKLIPVKK